MSNSKAISFRVPNELLVKIDKLAEEKYKSHNGTANRSLVILDAIVNYFDTLSGTIVFNNKITVCDNVTLSEFRNLEQTVSVLIETVSKLSDTVKMLEQPIEEIISIEKIDETPHQLNIITMSDNVDNMSDINQTSLTVIELATRLNRKVENITNKRYKTKLDPGEFIKWTKELDPDGIGWEFKKEKGQRDGRYYST